MPAPELPVTFRPRRTRVVLLSAAVLVLAVFTAVALLLPDEGPTAWGAGDRAALVASGVVLFGVLALFARPKIVAGRDGVTVVNLTTRRYLAWAELVRVNLRPGDPWVYLDLADGTSMAAMAIQPGAGKAQAVAAARRLRDLADRYGRAPARDEPDGPEDPDSGGPGRPD